MENPTDVTTDFFSRQNMQQIMLRGADLLSRPIRDEAKDICRELVAWAASMDGYLSDLEEAGYGGKPYTHLFTTPTPTTSKWCANRVSLHTGNGVFFVCLEQQVMIEGKRVIPTRRYRLRVGTPDSEPQYAICLADLRPAVSEYIADFDPYLPLSSQELLDGLFGSSDISPVRNMQDKDDLS